jgi:hypothetical protein
LRAAQLGKAQQALLFLAAGVSFAGFPSTFQPSSRTHGRGYAAENLGLLRRLALTLLQQERSRKVGIQLKRLSAGWDERYLLKVLNGKVINI